MLQLNYCRVVICSSLSPCVLILFSQFLFNIRRGGGESCTIHVATVSWCVL
jgi:hypothetical protein